MNARAFAIGCCAPASELHALEDVERLDYIELPVAMSLMTADGEFDAVASSLRRSRLGTRAANVFLPASLKVVGPDADATELSNYAATALDRARDIGIRLLVFGSGASRTAPPGFPPHRALDQLESAVRLVAREATVRGITVALEPLHSAETNLLNSVTEAAAFLRDRKLVGVRLVADLWHMECEGEGLEAIAAAGDLIAHSHVAAAERRAPGQAADNIEAFLRSLRDAGYGGACSIECRWSDLEVEVPVAVTRVREAATSAGWAAR